ncbi:MAG: hypothetical protein ACM3JP_01325 [Betaproteobacteria bacterium]
MLFRLAYLAVSNGLAMLRLLPMSDRAKDVEILALRHQFTVLERQLHSQGHKIRFAPVDRAFLAALLHRLPRDVLHRVRLLVRPETVLRRCAATTQTLMCDSAQARPSPPSPPADRDECHARGAAAKIGIHCRPRVRAPYYAVDHLGARPETPHLFISIRTFRREHTGPRGRLKMACEASGRDRPMTTT